MNKVLYLTSAMDNESFKEYLKMWRVAPNLSNQNFHNKLVRALSLSVDVDVVSYRSINIHFSKILLPAKVYKENNIYWKYPYTSISKVFKFFDIWKRIKKITLFDQKAVFVDALNLSLLKIAFKIRKKYGIKVIAICTDNPNNISYSSHHYKRRILKLGRDADAYIVLTDKINELFNVNGKPFIKIDGISESLTMISDRLINGDYIYFGGSLMKEYGVYNLIKAFQNLNRDDLKLILCGHHADYEKLNKAIGNTDKIRYLGPIDYYENLSLEKFSRIAINPRPINPKIDDYSVPSKTLEYLANGCLTVSVNNELLKSKYEDCIVWAESGSPSDLQAAIEKALALSEEEKEKMIDKGQAKVMDDTSLNRINSLTNYLLTEFFFN